MKGGLGQQAPRDRLILIDIIQAHGPPMIVQTIWTVRGDVRRGRRETRCERFFDERSLRARIDELLPLLFDELPAAKAAA
jgi:hypothetical protein